MSGRTDCPTGTEDVRFHWRSDNRLRAMKLLSGSADSLDFFYDASGRLVRQDVNGDVSRYFLWNGANLFSEFTDSGSKIAEYSYYPGLDHLHALVIDTIPYFAHADGLGNVIALTDEAKTVQRQYTYDDIWGTGSDASGSLPCPMADCDRARFKGALYLEPEAGLYYMRNRWYEARTGRFLSEDPIGLAGGVNQYSYAAGDPVNGRDPLGLCTEGQELWAEVTTKYDRATGVILDSYVSGYRCVSSGREPTSSGGVQMRRVRPNECPAPPPSPVGVSVDANVRTVLDYGSGRMPVFTFSSLVKPGGDWDYKRDAQYEYEAFGNFNYGATAAAMGFAHDFMHDMAGAVANSKSKRLSLVRGAVVEVPAMVFVLAKTPGILFVGRSWPDTGDDPANIHAGMQYFRNGCGTR